MNGLENSMINSLTSAEMLNNYNVETLIVWMSWPD